ncbi:LPP20 family lipoprotein [Helicobacter baculiformis]|uniref:LPP20 family lipoprotein n=1 Tax=Helicobacter baculiformis TaxID=427351 RepID=A0ABV7ZHX6_9HELI|nr:LPP20 family lipoprotein [Helicobacter baculiformis]
MVSRKFRWALVTGSVAVALAVFGCKQEPQSGVSKENKEYRAQTKGAPKWVDGDLSEVKMHDKEYSSTFLGRGEDDILNGDVSYATEQAAAKARANLATNLKSELIKDVQNMTSRSGKTLDKNSSATINLKVDRELVATKQLARWVGKDKVWVLVGLDEDIVYKIRAELGLKSK